MPAWSSEGVALRRGGKAHHNPAGGGRRVAPRRRQASRGPSAIGIAVGRSPAGKTLASAVQSFQQMISRS